jgi:hypothetical protein
MQHTFTHGCATGAYPQLAPLAIVQGVLYSVALAIELFGIYSAATVSCSCNDPVAGSNSDLAATSTCCQAVCVFVRYRRSPRCWCGPDAHRYSFHLQGESIRLYSRPSSVNIGQTELIQECVSFAQNGEVDTVSILL